MPGHPFEGKGRPFVRSPVTHRGLPKVGAGVTSLASRPRCRLEGNSMVKGQSESRGSRPSMTQAHLRWVWMEGGSTLSPERAVLPETRSHPPAALSQAAGWKDAVLPIPTRASGVTAIPLTLHVSTLVATEPASTHPETHFIPPPRPSCLQPHSSPPRTQTRRHPHDQDHTIYLQRPVWELKAGGPANVLAGLPGTHSHRERILVLVPPCSQLWVLLAAARLRGRVG